MLGLGLGASSGSRGQKHSLGDAHADEDAQDAGCPKAGSKLLLAVGYLKSYTAEMGDTRVSCSGGCTCDRTTGDAVDPLAGWHHSRSSITWIDWVSVTLAREVQPSPRQRTKLEWTAESCPCVMHFETFESSGWARRQGTAGPLPMDLSSRRRREQQRRRRVGVGASLPAFKFKINSMMVSHQGDMSWIDPWKAREMPIRRRS